MAIETPKTYQKAVTYGRFNLPHKGHLKLFREMYSYAEQIYIGISDNARNLPVNRRMKALGTLLEAAGIRYTLIPAPHPFAFFEKVRALGGDDEMVTCVFGEDQYALGAAANRAYEWDDQVSVRLTSSSALRRHIDSKEWDLVASLVPTSIIGEVIELRRLELDG